MRLPHTKNSARNDKQGLPRRYAPRNDRGRKNFQCPFLQGLRRFV